jgi:hypothetical protein
LQVVLQPLRRLGLCFYGIRAAAAAFTHTGSLTKILQCCVPYGLCYGSPLLENIIKLFTPYEVCAYLGHMPLVQSDFCSKFIFSDDPHYQRDA